MYCEYREMLLTTQKWNLCDYYSHLAGKEIKVGESQSNIQTQMACLQCSNCWSSWFLLCKIIEAQGHSCNYIQGQGISVTCSRPPSKWRANLDAPCPLKWDTIPWHSDTCFERGQRAKDRQHQAFYHTELLPSLKVLRRKKQVPPTFTLLTKVQIQL